MTMMLSASTKSGRVRKLDCQFVERLSQALPVTLAGGSRMPPSVTLVWPEHQSNARPIVCVASQQFQEFFAFVSTYNTSVRPYTAYFRVIPLELAGILENTGRERRNEMRLAKDDRGR